MDSGTFDAWFSLGTGELARRAVLALKSRHHTVALAESCTGGLVASALTSVPGSSGVFSLGVVTYSNESKVAVLGVPEDVLEKFGAVSAECVRAMSLGVQGLAGSDASVAVSGIAGPDGGTADKPVGTVWIGVACAKSLGESVRKRVAHEARPSGRIPARLGEVAKGPTPDVELAAVCIQFDGGRESVREQSVRAALSLLLVAIGEQP